jgi:hypothetical protein
MDTTMMNHIVAATDRAGHGKRIGLHPEKHSAVNIASAHILVASDPPSMVQQTRGHTLALLSESWLALSETSTYVHVFQLKVRFNRMNLIFAYFTG